VPQNDFYKQVVNNAIMKNLFAVFILSLLLGCSPEIKSLIEYKQSEDPFTKRRVAHFDKKGNLIYQRRFYDNQPDRVVKTTYEDGKKVEVTRCDYIEKKDTCDVVLYSIYEYKPKGNLTIEKMYGADSGLRILRKYHRTENLKVVETKSWQMFPSRAPDPEKAVKLTDSIFYDSKGRVIKKIHYNKEFKKPRIEKYNYSDTGYMIHKSGDTKDTTIFHRYVKPKSLSNRNLDKIEFDFKDTTIYEYKINYY
jgi:hypothetical protein